MKELQQRETPIDDESAEAVEAGGLEFTRRGFVQVLGAGLVISVSAATADGQQRGRGRGQREARVAARLHISQDGTITVMSGKIEMGQGARGELTQAAAEELHVPLGQVQMLLADTSLVPDDGLTAGSRTTPSTVPAVRQGAAAARELLLQLVCRKWQILPQQVTLQDGRFTNQQTSQSLSYGDLATADDLGTALDQPVPGGVSITPVEQWRVLGKSPVRPGLRDYVTGSHKFPSDLAPEGMFYGKVLRPPSYGATLKTIDLSPGESMPDVIVVRDGDFVGVAAPTSLRAEQALNALAKTAVWQPQPHPSSEQVYDYLRSHVSGEVPGNPFGDEQAKAQQTLKQSYHVAYVQHVPMETRTALAQWQDGSLTVWTGTQNPFGYHRELSGAFGLANDKVRVIVPDFGCGFGGKHTGEAASEAARLARVANRPVIVRWTREEEFTWAYFRPAAVIDVQASLDQQGRLASWHFVNINSGGAALDTPYAVPQAKSQFVRSDAPLRQGSYRVLAATANNFARESFMDELALAAQADPLEFRLAHLQNERIRGVLDKAAREFGWSDKFRQKQPNRGVGLACGTEKNSVVAACVEIEIEPAHDRIVVRHVCEAFECGAILNPDNLRASGRVYHHGVGSRFAGRSSFRGGEKSDGHL